MAQHPLVGKRIRLLAMPDDPSPLPIGTTGTVEHVSEFSDGWRQLWVKWDIPRTLHLAVPPDRFEMIE